jgi:Zn-dependent M16 (insulinase) family peptidase
MLRASRACAAIARPLSRRSLATVSSVSSSLPKPGDTLHGFTTQRIKHVPEFDLTAFQFRHDKTGAEYIHVARDDTNNVFSIGFKTNPPDDTGVPHILEHVTLCGSEQYPVRDPFFKMLPRSLSNFMNAFTSSDYTSYPFATTNQQDFRNLMSVYLDATLHPLLTTDDFSQEGWRVGPENPKAAVDQKDGSDLVFKGVVYNEMKGQMSDVNYLYYIRFQDHIFPAINNSGGDPAKITDLTHGQLKAFHDENYHPSNSRVFTYGDLPLAEHLQELNSRFESFQKLNLTGESKLPISLSEGPRTVTIKGPIDPLLPPDMQFKTSTSWLTCDSSDIVETFALQILSSLLISGYGSPLYRGLIDEGLGAEWSPNTGFDSSGKTGIFSIGLSGVKDENVSKVKEAISRTLAEVRHNGFDKQKIDGILHRLEISLKHKTAQFGLELMNRLQPGWFNGVDPFTMLEVDTVVNEFKKRYAEGDYLESLLEKYLLNDKTLTFTMEPSETYAAELAAEEASRLKVRIAQVEAEVGDAVKAVEKLRAQELELLKIQEEAKSHSLDCLPTVHIKDVPRQGERKPIRQSSIGDVSVQWREAPTNGLSYFRAVNPFTTAISSELRSYIPLFTDAVFRLGTKNLSTEQLEDLIKLKTGGISVGYHLTSSPSDTEHFTEGLALSGYALDRNVPDMFGLLRAVLVETNFDDPSTESKIRQLLQGDANNAINAIAETGHAYAMRYAQSSVSNIAKMSEEASGLTQIQRMSALALRPASEGFTDVIDKLKQIQALVLNSSKDLKLAMTCASDSTSSNEREMQSFINSTFSPANSPSSSSLTPEAPSFASTTFSLPYQVSYASLALPTTPYTSPLSAPTQLLSQILTHKYLHHEIREKGGAYGAGASANSLRGVWSFYSYRDPNPLNSLAHMKQAALEVAATTPWTARDIEEAKLLTFQGVDAPVSVSEEGMGQFLYGVTPEMRQERRERLLDCGLPEIRQAADLLVRTLEAGKSAGVVIGPPAALGDALKEWRTGELGPVTAAAAAAAAAEEAGDL